MGKIMKDGISYSGSTYTGGTDIEITGANVINAKVRELTQAQYDALSSAEKNNGTTYYITDGIPSVIGVTDVTDGNTSIVSNHVADITHKVNKSGDTMTGDLNINSNNARTKYINPNMTLDTSANNGLSSDSSYGAYFTDKNGNAVGDVSVTTRSNGRNYAQLMARNKKTDGTAVTNYIDVIADKDGSSSYYVSNPAAFRTSIDVNSSFSYYGETTGTTAKVLPNNWKLLISQVVYNGVYLTTIFTNGMMTTNGNAVSLGNYGTSYAIGQISKNSFKIVSVNWAGSDVTSSSKAFIYLAY